MFVHNCNIYERGLVVKIQNRYLDYFLIFVEWGIDAKGAEKRDRHLRSHFEVGPPSHKCFGAAFFLLGTPRQKRGTGTCGASPFFFSLVGF